MAKKAQGVPTNNLAVFTPYTLFALAPYLDSALEASTRSPACLLFPRGHQMVDAERMRFVECLNDRKFRLRGIVDVDAARARS